MDTTFLLAVTTVPLIQETVNPSTSSENSEPLALPTLFTSVLSSAKDTLQQMQPTKEVKIKDMVNSPESNGLKFNNVEALTLSLT